MTLPADFTPNLMKEIDARLSVFCPSCRVIREVDLLALSVAGRGTQRVRSMLWKCGKCGDAGQPSATWWDGEQRRYEFYTAKLSTGKPPHTYG